LTLNIGCHLVKLCIDF